MSSAPRSRACRLGCPSRITVDPRTLRVRARSVEVELLALGAVLALADGRARSDGEGPGLCGGFAARACASACLDAP